MIDPKTGERGEGLIHYDPSDLTTHGVIVGMTGSGKTGLGIIFLEEALLAGIPTLIIDPKGDMTNLLLTFPDLLPSDFEPWIDEGKARKEEKTVAELADETAALWKKGLGWWDQDGARIAELKAKAGFAVYTPGSSAGIPVNIVGSLANPGLDWDTDAEILRDEIQGFVSGLLGLTGIAADPISSREHILISNLIEHAWRQDRSLDLASLLGAIQHPPMRKLGVFELDTFFPEKDRLALAMKLNGLVASPSFAAWMEGPPLDVGSLMFDADGKPQASVIYLAHLSEQERQFIVTLLLSKVVTWMRSQSGTGDLRAMVYMDEVFGFVPPTAQPPAKKPILTLLKQARAFGVGLLLSTQNPVDLDYKAMSNAGTWCVGRLQTERDKARIVEALKSASGDSDVSSLDATISGLDKRQFLLQNIHEKEPVLFTTRWALSYLRGPLTRDEVSDLMESAETPPPAARPQADATPIERPAADEPLTEALGDNETPVPPKIAANVSVYYLDEATPWAADVGASPTSTRYQAAIAAQVRMVYDDTAAKLTHSEEWEAIFTPLTRSFDVDRRYDVDYDERDFRGEPPEQATYLLPEAKLDTKTYFTSVASGIKEHLYRNQTITIYANRKLKLYSRVGETREKFDERCDQAGQKLADVEAAKLRDKYEARIDRVRDRLDTAERRVAELEVDLQGQKQKTMVEGASAVINILLGRRSTRSVTGTAASRRAARSKEQRLSSAQDKADELRELDTDLILELEEINDKWEDVATEVEDVEVGLEKTDIKVDEVALVWIPVD